MKRIINNFKKYRYLLFELVKKDVKLKYRSSVLGLLWTLLEPLLTMIVLTIVFETIQEKKIPNFSVYVLTGRLLYAYFANGTKLALKAIRRNSSMIRKVYVPKYIYPLSSALSGYVTFLISLIVLVAVSAVKQIQPTWHLIEALIPLLTILVMVIGIGFILATLDVFFRDTEYLWNVVTMLIMYLSAIFYDGEDFISNKRFGMLLKLNPLYNVITNFRHAVFGEAMNLNYMLYSMGFSIIVLIVGVGLFYKKQDKFVLYV